MRWLLLKDLQIMRRSPLVTALLVAYPIVIAVLIGFALSRGPEKPRVAFLNEVPPDTPLEVGGESFDLAGAKSELCDRIDCVPVSSEEEARQKVESGDVLGALILPADLVDKLQTLAGLTPESPTVKVLVNEEDPVKAGLVDDRINSLLAEANLRISQEVSNVSNSYLQILLNGGDFSFLGQGIQVLGLKRSEQILRGIRGQLPADSPDLDELDSVIRFSHLAAENLGAAGDLLNSVSQPIKVDKEVVSGGTPSLDTFAIAVAATITLMFVTVLLVAGSLALEREENAFARLTRGLVSKSALLGEKVLLGVVVAVVVTLLMLAGLGLFVDLDWGRFALWIPAIVAGGAGFAAFGAAIGGAAKEVRAASLLAFMISLPVAFLSLIPSGTVAPGLFDVISVITALFPFDPALRALTGALDAAGPAIGIAILHLAILAVAYGVLARFAVRRFV
ncbi:MAG TPA: ABC transporter permease [Solirubrobacterales bacterium]|jgi:ABC-2 type transport system permease protein|nr:ABC transporter permease [Solirubrobacterales bacterium]